MRELCNVAYAMQVENLDNDELREFDAKLEGEPGKPVRISRGTTELMRILGPPRG